MMSLTCSSGFFFFLFSLPQPVLPVLPFGILQAVAKLNSFFLNVQQGEHSAHPSVVISCLLKSPVTLNAKSSALLARVFTGLYVGEQRL